ncbi:MAG TPA: TonB-dependent receptor [Longimicrobiales bacterium]
MRFTIACCIALVLPAAAAAQEARITFRGDVRDAAGAPVAGATVELAGPAEAGVLTDAAGAFALAVPAGSYELRVWALGYDRVTRRVGPADAAAPMAIVLAHAPLALAPLEVQAARRSGVSAATLPVKVEVIGQAELATQRALSTNPTELLANVVPSFSPSRQKLTNSGESLRGRRPLFLIDGVPQSNPLRDGQREGFTIDMEVIERVEVVFGANAIQGLGATGGIVNYVTVNPPVTGEFEQRASLTGTASDEFEGDGFGWRASWLGGRDFGAFDVLGSFSWEERGLQFDAQNRAIGLDNTQGDVADSHSRNLFAKVGWEPRAGQRVQLMVNDFRLAQEGSFALVPGDRDAGTPATSVEGAPEGTEPLNDVTTISLDYENTGFADGVLSAKAYWQDFAALYGGGRFASFQDPRIEPVGELFDQSENNSEKYGTRLTWSRGGLLNKPVDLITGFDFHRDLTFQRLVHTDRNWVPETRFYNYAPFAQLDVTPLSWLTLSGGVRWELAQLDVDDFETLAGNRDDYEIVTVEGGTPSFDESLYNVGAVVTPLRGLRVYGTFAQAYTMPDVGRVLRGVSEPGTTIDDLLTLTPIETDNTEVGGAWSTEHTSVSVSYFESESEFGSRLVANADGFFEVVREPTRTSGWEFAGRVVAHPLLALGAAYSILDGTFDGDGDGSLESDLGAADVGPDRLNLTADLNQGGRISGRLQSFTFFDETFEDGAGVGTARFDGYTTIDASVGARLGPSRVILSVGNLLDEQYITYYGQAGTTLDDRYFAGRGRTLTLRVETAF